MHGQQQQAKRLQENHSSHIGILLQPLIVGMNGAAVATATLPRCVASGPGYLRPHCVIHVAGN